MPSLRRPLKTHGLLLEILTSHASKADSQAESAKLRSGRGETPVGTSAAHRNFTPESYAKPTCNPALAIEALAKAKSILKGEKHGT